MNRTTCICFTFTVLLGIMVMCPGGLSAQSSFAPSSQPGVGVFMSGAATGGGVTGQYAIMPGVHVGLGLGFATSSKEQSENNVTTSTSSTRVLLDPYVRMLLEAVVNPFFQVGFRFGESSTTNKITVGGNTQEQSSISTSRDLYAAFGLEGFVSRNFGVYAAVDFLNVPFDSDLPMTFGLYNGRVGVEWFFTP